MGWARYAHSMRIFVFNSGYFYLRPTKASKDLLAKGAFVKQHQCAALLFCFSSRGRFILCCLNLTMDIGCYWIAVVYRVETENGWDQALFNECIFFPNSPKNQDPAVTRRAMNIEVFMNSKVLFKFLRHDVERYKSVMPAAVHVNYHPQKFERMQSVWRRYVDNDTKALDEWPDGSE
jgi:arabinosyltransferase